MLLKHPSVQEGDGILMDRGPIRARKTRARRHAGAKVEEGFAPEREVGRDELGLR